MNISKGTFVPLFFMADAPLPKTAKCSAAIATVGKAENNLIIR